MIDDLDIFEQLLDVLFSHPFGQSCREKIFDIDLLLKVLKGSHPVFFWFGKRIGMNGSIRKLKDRPSHLRKEIQPSLFGRDRLWLFSRVGKMDKHILPDLLLVYAFHKNDCIGNGFVELPGMDLEGDFAQDRLSEGRL